MKRILITIMAVAALTGSSYGKSVFFIGSSTTDQSYGFKEIAISKGQTATWGKKTMAGSSLMTNWDNPCNGIAPSSLDNCINPVLTAKSWDALVMQSGDRSLLNDIDNGERFAKLAWTGNPNCNVYVFAKHPRKDTTGVSFQTIWDRKDNNTYRYTRFFWQSECDSLRRRNPGKSVYVVPMGDCMYELDKMMRAGSVPGYKNVWDLYLIKDDGTPDLSHLNNDGKYMQAACVFATLYKMDPEGATTSGLYFWAGPYSVTAAWAKIAWDLVWKVVPAYPASGFGTTSVSKNVPAAAYSLVKPQETGYYTISGRKINAAKMHSELINSGVYIVPGKGLKLFK